MKGQSGAMLLRPWESGPRREASNRPMLRWLKTVVPTLGELTAVVVLADVCELALLGGQLDPLQGASSYGFAVVVSAAPDAGVDRARHRRQREHRWRGRPAYRAGRARARPRT
jgi:hypothetical protein